MNAYLCRSCPAAVVVGDRAARRHVLAHPGHSLSPQPVKEVSPR